MSSELKTIIDSYYTAIGISANMSRLQEQVQSRAAIMSAMRRYRTTMEIAKAFGMDHSTVVYHANRHDANMVMWTGYDEKFKIARRICNETLRFKTLNGKLKSIQEEIARLQRMEKKLINHISEKQQLLQEQV